MRIGVALPLIFGRPDREHYEVGYALVDFADYDWARHYTWHLDADGYAYRYTPRPTQPRRILLHREILGLALGNPLIGDHINRDRLDARRVNLRSLEKPRSNHNMSAHRDGSSSHRGVSYRADRSCWCAYASLNYERHYLGHFTTEAEAAAAARAWRLANMSAAID